MSAEESEGEKTETDAGQFGGFGSAPFTKLAAKINATHAIEVIDQVPQRGLAQAKIERIQNETHPFTSTAQVCNLACTLVSWRRSWSYAG
jgi:hypothetical protein